MVVINSFKYPESDIRCQSEDVRVFLDKKDLGKGTLFVSESTLCWRQREDIGFTIGYPSISLHAISKDTNIHPKDCVYIMTDGHITMPGELPPPKEEDDDSDCESNADISEILLIPANDESISQIYEAIKICQELNPDPMDDEDDDNEDLSEDNDDNLYEDAEDDMEEGEYEVRERGGGDADVDDLARRIQSNSVDIQINYRNGTNEEEDFQDAD
ncbi:unnamed protein product [Psylliodes chrysocephalus]|uniref:Methylosome subunit pICln n=1 Tax=Psylliodes chrysocephalus TaxID=3402493 RepID=A0A9P0CI06_9CUCU|nr:unnamed protein product [Psylliodes chrysocephala]